MGFLAIGSQYEIRFQDGGDGDILFSLPSRVTRAD